MAYSKASSDRTAIRHDTGGLFGGMSLRDDLGDTQMMSLSNGSLTVYNIDNTYRVTYKAVSGSYVGAGDTGMTVRSNFMGEFNEGGDSSANDYMLDWARSRFNSISMEYWNETTSTWVLGYKYVMTGTLADALPARGTSDTTVLQELKDYISTSSSATYANTFYNNWEYQCALFNWQYPEGNSYVQYLFGGDSLNGTRGADVLNGGAGNDTISGGVGDDVIQGSFGQDLIYGNEGNDVLIFDGGSSVWNYKGGSDTSRGTYGSGIDCAAGGSGKDYFTFQLPTVSLLPGDAYYPDLPDLNGTSTSPITRYNPFLSQSQNSTPFNALASWYGISQLTFRTRVLDFKVGEDKLDLSNFGIDTDFITNKALTKLSGAAFITAANLVLKLDGYALLVGKSQATSYNTTLFVTEAGVDTNGNGTTKDVLLEIELVGLSNSSISMKMFGEVPSV